MNNDLISRNALKEAIEQGEGFSWDSHGKDDLCVRKKYIDNAPTIKTYCYFCGQTEHGQIEEKPQGDLISREVVKKEIDKFIGYLDEDMIYRIKVAIDKVPTVAVDNYSMGYQDGVRKVLSERPKGGAE